MSIAILSQVLALAIGLPLGALAGWQGGKTDCVIMRLVAVMSALPVLLLAFLIMLRMGASYWNVLLAISITSWIEICRLTRGQFLTLREKEFVEASCSVGARTPRIITWHLLPNAMAPIIVSVTLGIPRAIFAEAALSFLGVGINPPTPSWRQMIGREGVANMSYFIGGAYTDDLPPSAMAKIMANPELPQEHIQWLNFMTYYLFFDNANPPFDNLKLRQAISHAIDRNKIVNGPLQYQSTAAFTMNPPGFPLTCSPTFRPRIVP